MMPAWIHGLGSLLMGNLGFYITIVDLLKNLAVLILPCLLGILLGSFTTQAVSARLKAFAKKANKIQSPALQIVFLVLIFISHIYCRKFSRINTFFPGMMMFIKNTQLYQLLVRLE
jgi:hypothetical protein